MGLFCSPSQSLWAQAQMTAVLDLLGTIASIFVVVWVSKLLKPPSWMKTEQIASPLSYRDLRKTAPWDANSTRKLSGSWFAPSFFLSFFRKTCPALASYLTISGLKPFPSAHIDQTVIKVFVLFLLFSFSAFPYVVAVLSRRELFPPFFQNWKLFNISNLPEILLVLANHILEISQLSV